MKSGDNPLLGKDFIFETQVWFTMDSKFYLAIVVIIGPIGNGPHFFSV